METKKALVRFYGIDSLVPIEVTDAQLDFIKSSLEYKESVPYYTTTYGKKKFGDCLMGNIVEIQEIVNL